MLVMLVILLKDLPSSAPNWEPFGLKWIGLLNLTSNREQFSHGLRCAFSCVKLHFFFYPQSKQIKNQFFLSLKLSTY